MQDAVSFAVRLSASLSGSLLFSLLASLLASWLVPLESDVAVSVASDAISFAGISPFVPHLILTGHLHSGRIYFVLKSRGQFQI